MAAAPAFLQAALEHAEDGLRIEHVATAHVKVSRALPARRIAFALRAYAASNCPAARSLAPSSALTIICEWRRHSVTRRDYYLIPTREAAARSLRPSNSSSVSTGS